MFFAIQILAQDTTKIRVHDHTDMTWYGNYDEWGVFPDGSQTFRKILLHYTMGCPSSGCAPYDYTTKIEVMHRTGSIDSSLQSSPTFTVNGNILDSVMFSDSTYVHFWDTVSNSIDSALSTILEIIQFNDASNPTVATDTMYYYQSGFYNMIFDSTGNIIDSFYVAPANINFISYHSWWDYFDVIERFELARVITPYGGNIPSSFAFTHTFDITDFAHLLEDSVEIRAHYSGWGNGWSATLDFEFIEGTPARNVTYLHNIYKGTFSYVNSNDFENNKLYAKKFWIDQSSSQAMIKMTTTGHGFDNNIYAAEFKPIDYYINIDGSLTHTQFNWRDDCGENPIYPYFEVIPPNGGYIHTWILDRANWCPGLKAFAFDHEITPYITSSDSVEINVDFQSYVWGPNSQGGNQTPSYIIDCQLFQYENANFSNSVEILDIIKPSIKDEYSRFNPVCGKPLIKIRNYGSTALTSIEIEYGIEGGVTNTYAWNGNLSFLEQEEVELPLLQNWGGTKDIFYAILKNPNGQVDDYPDNNMMSVKFEYAPIYANKFAIWTTINNGVINGNISETSWKILKDDGTLHSTSQQMMLGNQPSNQYRDTVEFTNGCYTLIIEDAGEDGLYYGYNNDGKGSINLRNVPGTFFKEFDPNFGSNIIHNFIVGSILSQEDLIEELHIYPNPAKNNITIESQLMIGSKIQIINVLGETVVAKISTSNLEVINLSNVNSGIYTLIVEGQNKIITKKFIKQ